MSSNKSVAIRLKPSTRDYLGDVGGKNETYDDVIKRLITEHGELESQLVFVRAKLKALQEERMEAEG